MGGIRALVVEDVENWQEIIRDALESCSPAVAVDVARTYHDACALLERATYAIVTLDMALGTPDANLRVAVTGGWRLLIQRLAQQASGIAIFVISGSFDTEPMRVFELSSKHHVTGFMTKDEFDLPRLQTWVEEVQRRKDSGTMAHSPSTDQAGAHVRQLPIEQRSTRPAGRRAALAESGSDHATRKRGSGQRDEPELERPPEPIAVTLRFRPTKLGAEISWESSSIGAVHSKFTMPYNHQVLPLVLNALDASQRLDHPHSGPQFSAEERSRLTTLGLWRNDRVPAGVHVVVGRALYAALIYDRAAEMALATVRALARNQDKPLCYVLRFPPDAVELASLPWETLHDGHQALLLSRGGRDVDSCVRYLDIGEALSPPLPAGRHLRILALSPRTGITDDVRKSERAARTRSWNALQAQGLLEWDELSPVTITDLDDRMRRGPAPDIIHYYGHGLYRSGTGYLLFDNPGMPGQVEAVSASRLAAQLGGVRLIVLHACQSAMVLAALKHGGLLTGIAPALSRVSEAVVAMQLAIRIEAATRFSEVFYEEIGRGRSLQAAVAEARRSLYVIEGDGASWYVPALYIRTVEQKPVYFVRPAASHGLNRPN